MQKFIALFVCAALLLTAVGCEKEKPKDSSDISSHVIDETGDCLTDHIHHDETDSTVTDGSSETKTESDKPTGNSNATSSSAGGNKKPQSGTAANDAYCTGGAATEEITITGKVPTQQNQQKVEVATPPNTNHTPISADKFYQYSCLDANKLKVYNKIIKAISETKNVIDVSEFGITSSEVFAILQYVLTDHPEYFYVSRSYRAASDSVTNKAVVLFLYYTDGVTVDELDDNYKLVKTANRNTIKDHVEAVNKKTKEILDTIDANLTDDEKVRLIHDYLVLNTTYDKAAANETPVFGKPMSQALNIYGTLCQKKAVCEGYAKAFMYLCRRAGINATTIAGTAKGSSHMWNTVQIENDWYLIDVTWADLDDGEMINYGYYNLTTSEMNTTHTPDGKTFVPSCTATRHSFKNTFAINVEGGTLSSNYKTVIDEAVIIHDNHIYLYFGSNMPSQDFLISKFFADDSPINSYIKEKGYNLKLVLSYGIVNKYVILTFE